MGDGDRREVRQQVRSGRGSVNTLAAGDVGDVHVTNNYYRAKWAGVIALAVAVVFGVVYHFAGDPDVRDAFASGPSLHVTVQTRDSVVNHNGAWLFPGRLLSPGQTLHTDQVAAVMSKRSDKVDTYETTTLVTVEGNRSHTVDITGIHIKVRSKATPAPGGTLLVYPSQGEDTNIKIGFNLDEPVPVPRNADREGKAFGGHYFDGHSVSVKAGEIVNFGFTFQTVKWDVTYDLVLDEVIDGEHTTQTVTNGSRPFHTRGFASAYDQAVGPYSRDGSFAVTDRAKAIEAMCGTPCTVRLTQGAAATAK
ncbi:hypothetical protein [Streptomyces yunnanensis]|uniref:Uncharacterized protein n=1 Tax=Streptomyces yunnanensis TaxID=156453 RepID=A0A9X8MZJ7_9ACTN|nr:hypothetical protein [Streptomyces yunnanensis]SHM43546.1 hypothetical protein SAMN05216268_1117 [Streptomyces yunnanensis]